MDKSMYPAGQTRRGSNPYRRGSLAPLDLEVPLFCNAFPRRCFLSKQTALGSPTSENRLHPSMLSPDIFLSQTNKMDMVDGEISPVTVQKSTEGNDWGASPTNEARTSLATYRVLSNITDQQSSHNAVEQRALPAHDKASSLNIDRTSSSITGERKSLITERTKSPITGEVTSLVTDRRSSLFTEHRSSPITYRRSSLFAGQMSLPATARRSSLNTDRRSSLTMDQRSSLIGDRRSSLIGDRRSSLIGDRRTSLIDDRMSSMMTDRSLSLVTNRSSLVTDQATSRVTESKLPVIPFRRYSLQTDFGNNDEISTNHAERRYSVINAPKEIHEFYKSQKCTKKNYEDKTDNSERMGYEKNKKNRHWITKNTDSPNRPSRKPVLASVHSQEDEKGSTDLDDGKVDEVVQYRPKPCWCLRCMIMQSMYNTKDERLALWGNYPCFRRGSIPFQ